MTDHSLSRRQLCAALAALPLAGAIGLSAAARAGTNVPDDSFGWDDGGMIAVSGGRLNWRRIGGGSGMPVVLLHKLGGWIADWRHIAPLLAAERPLIAIDLPGHGDSAMYGPPPFIQTVPESAAMIASALKELGVDRYGLLGNSLGGVIAIAMAAYLPGSVHDLSLVSVSLASGISRAELAEKERGRDPAVWTEDWRPLPRTGAATAMFGTIDPAIADEQNRSRAKADRWVRPSERGAAVLDIAGHLARTQCPVQVMIPQGGSYARFADVPQAARPDAELVRIADAGSFMHQEAPDVVAAELLRFWRSIGN